MVNLYAILNIPQHANEAEIRVACQKAYQQGVLSDDSLKKAEMWLTHPQIKPKYDAKLQAYLGKQQVDNQFECSSTAHSTIQTTPSMVTFLSPKPTVNPIFKFKPDFLPDDLLLGALLGRRKPDYYLSRFDCLEQKKSAGWNASAWMGGGYWCLSKGMWFWGILLIIFSLLVWLGVPLALWQQQTDINILLTQWLPIVACWLLIRCVCFPLYATDLYHRFAKRHIQKMKYKYQNRDVRLLTKLASKRGHYTVMALVGLCHAAIIWVLLIGSGILL